MSLGLRVQGQYIRPYGGTQLPIFEKVFIGGEYSIRGFDLRSVGPRDATTGLVMGGNKNLLFNAEYMVTVAGPVRLLAFFDAGQVRDVGENFAMKENVYKTETIGLTTPLLYDPTNTGVLTDPNAPKGEVVKTLIGHRDAFKTSTGLELRFFMPVLNVPFRLKSEAQDEAFLKGAQAAGMVELKGHRSVGGMRASIYNAMPIAGVQALVDYMRDFEKKNG